MTEADATEKKPSEAGQRNDLDIEELVEQYFSTAGPLPSPESLKRYEEVVPGAAERLLRLATEHQANANRLAARAAARAQYWWGVVAGCSTALGLFMSAVLFTMRNTHTGDVLGLFAPILVGIAGAVVAYLAAHYSSRGHGKRA